MRRSWRADRTSGRARRPRPPTAPPPAQSGRSRRVRTPSGPPSPKPRAISRARRRAIRRDRSGTRRRPLSGPGRRCGGRSVRRRRETRAGPRGWARHRRRRSTPWLRDCARSGIRWREAGARRRSPPWTGPWRRRRRSRSSRRTWPRRCGVGRPGRVSARVRAPWRTERRPWNGRCAPPDPATRSSRRRSRQRCPSPSARCAERANSSIRRSPTPPRARHSPRRRSTRSTPRRTGAGAGPG
jgi:hypothetical protein